MFDESQILLKYIYGDFDVDLIKNLVTQSCSEIDLVK